MKDRTIIALVALGGTFLIQALCILGIIQGVNGLLVGIFSGAGSIGAAVTGYYFARNSDET